MFVGFGASAPERQWDDYGEIDLAGKVAVFLVNDPDFAAGPDEAAAGRFGNRRMTYYGRWTYKFEEAERRGALAALVIHEDKAAGIWLERGRFRPGRELLDRARRGICPTPRPPGLAARRCRGAAVCQRRASTCKSSAVLARSPDFQAFELEGVTFSAEPDSDRRARRKPERTWPILARHHPCR